MDADIEVLQRKWRQEKKIMNGKTIRISELGNKISVLENQI